MKKKNDWWVILVLVFVSLVVYANSFQNGFVWDDKTLIVANYYIRDGSNIGKIFAQDLFYKPWKTGNYYRPLQSLSFMLDYSLWRLKPFGYHLTNIAFHTICGLLVYLLILLLIKEKLPSIIASLFFLIHPMHTEAVTYISGRADSMVTALIVLSVILYLKSRISLQKELVLYGGSVISFLLALLTKENAVILPLILILCDSTLFEEKNRISLSKKLLSYLPFLIIAIIYIYLRLTILDFTKDHMLSHNLPFSLRILTFTKVIWNYLGIIIFPFNLHMERRIMPVISLFNLVAWIYLFMLSLILWIAAKNYKNSKTVLFGILWFFVTLFPVSNTVIPLFTYLAEHWLYLPYIGLCIVMAQVFLKLKQTIIPFLKLPVFGLVFLLISFYSTLTIRQNKIWKDEVTLFTYILKYDAYRNYLIHNNLGLAYEENGQLEEAFSEYEKALKIKPNYADTYANLGNIYYKQGLYEQATDSYQKALKYKPNLATAYNGLGVIYTTTGRYQEAILLHLKSLELNPYYVDAYYNLGNAYAHSEDPNKAEEAYIRVLKLEDSHFYAHNNLGNIYVRKNQYEKAITEFKKALECNPDFALTHYNLGLIYAQKGWYSQAIQEYMWAINIDGRMADAYSEIGNIYRITGNTKGAEEIAEKFSSIQKSEVLKQWIDNPN